MAAGGTIPHSGQMNEQGRSLAMWTAPSINREATHGLSDQLLPVRPGKAALRLPRHAVGRLNSLPEDAARRRDGERYRSEEGVQEEKSDEVGSGLGATEDVGLNRHVQGPESDECDVRSHIVSFLLDETVFLRACHALAQRSQDAENEGK